MDNPQKQSAIDKALSQLHRATNETGNTIGLLAERLIPILAAAPPTPEGKPATEKNVCSIEGTILDTQQLAEGNTHRLTDILEQLQI